MRSNFVFGLFLSPILVPILILTLTFIPGSFGHAGHEYHEIALNQSETSVHTTECGSYTYFSVDMPYPCLDLDITVRPIAGEPDIFVSRCSYEQVRDETCANDLPTYEKLTYAAFGDGDYSVLISHWDAESSPGIYYIGVTADCQKTQAAARYTVKTTLIENDSEDIFKNPQLAMNQVVKAEDYTYFKFCIPYHCATMNVVLENCIDSTACPLTYSWPELLVSRRLPNPTVNDKSYKLAQIDYRYIPLTPTDPSARNEFGYYEGSYYIGVYGWCTPDEYCPNFATCGPCAYASKSTFNVTLDVTKLSNSSCAVLEYDTEPTSIVELFSGDEYIVAPSNGVECDKYQYFKIKVPNPCVDLIIENYNMSGSECCQSGDIWVGKWPVVQPALNHNTSSWQPMSTWSSYQWRANKLTIQAWDPLFDGGKVCGKNNDEDCYYYIGVHGWCDLVTYPTLAGAKLGYNIKATLAPAHKIFATPQYNQNVKAAETNQYMFCVAAEESVSATMFSWTNACDCPDSYSSLDMVVSKTNKDAGIEDLVWRVRNGDEGRHSIDLLTTDLNTRPGTYYLNVVGNCVADASCTDKCTCSPCSNLNKNIYSLYVNEISQKAEADDMIGSCPNANTAAGVSTCTSVVCSSPSSTSHSGTHHLTAGEAAGLTFAMTILGIGIIYGSYIFLQSKASAKGCEGSSVEQFEDMQELSSHKEDNL